MKIAVISDEVSQYLSVSGRRDSLVDLIQTFREYGLNGIEIRSLFDRKGPHLLTDEEVERIATSAKYSKFEIPVIASPFFKCPFPETVSAMDEQLQILKRCIEIAQRLGTKIIRVFAFSAGSIDPWHEGTLSARETVLWAFKTAAEMAAKAGVILGIENEHTTAIDGVRKLVEVLDQINHPNVKAVYDPANDIWGSESPSSYSYWSGLLWHSTLHPTRTDYVRTHLEKLLPRLVHVHVKDALPLKPGFPSYSPPIGIGAVPWLEIIYYLTQKGYDGWWSIETHYRLEALTKEQVDRPGGAEYSKGGFDATLVCLHNFLELARQAGVR